MDCSFQLGMGIGHFCLSQLLGKGRPRAVVTRVIWACLVWRKPVLVVLKEIQIWGSDP